MALAIWVLTILHLSIAAAASQKSRFPAMFVFGDSLSDPGNNNDLVTLAKANFRPHGIDFPDGPTGRFCNGDLNVDHIAKLLGLPLIPPFNNKNTRGPKILKGLNYASAAGGIRNDTAKNFGEQFHMDEQIQSFQRGMSQLSSELRKIGVNNAREFLENSFFLVNIGSNDILNNYLLPAAGNAILYSPDEFVQLLIRDLNRQLRNLYNLGGRKFAVSGLGPLGCIPAQVGNYGLLKASGTDCVELPNQMAINFNGQLKSLLTQLNRDLRRAKFVYGEIYDFTLNVMNNPSQYGFKYPNSACCGIGRSNDQLLCLPELPAKCRNRSEYIFWDAFHPTSAFNQIVAKHAVETAVSQLM